MHTDTRQLLALIDGEPIDSAAREHALVCADCQSEIDRLQRTRARMQALPVLTPPALSPAVLAAMPRRSRWRSRAVAASGALVAIVTALWVTQRTDAPLLVDDDSASSSPEVVTPAPRGVSANLSARSAQLEREWRALNAHTGAVRRVGHERGTSRLKKRLLRLDAQFASGSNQRYWDQRVQLLNSLVDIERAELLAQNDRAYQVVRASQRQQR